MVGSPGAEIYDGGWWTGTLEGPPRGPSNRTAAYELPTDSYTWSTPRLVVRPIKGNRDLKITCNGA